MGQRTVSAAWHPGPLHTTVSFDESADLLVDEPVEVGGTGVGPQPTELFLASIASCFTLALVYAAGKLLLSPEAVAVEATGTYAGPRFSAIRIDVRLSGVAAEQQVELIALAERYCYVTNTMRRPPEITVTTA
ncbi:MAG: OsmC family protein [Nocardioides sp.]